MDHLDIPKKPFWICCYFLLVNLINTEVCRTNVKTFMLCGFIDIIMKSLQS